MELRESFVKQLVQIGGIKREIVIEFDKKKIKTELMIESQHCPNLHKKLSFLCKLFVRIFE